MKDLKRMISDLFSKKYSIYFEKEGFEQTLLYVKKKEIFEAIKKENEIGWKFVKIERTK